MDKLKQTLGPIYKHGFWIGCGAIVVVALITWLVATMGISKEEEEARANIVAKFGEAKQLQMAGNLTSTGAKVHPNEAIHTQTQRIVSRMRTSVTKAWELLYAEQIDWFTWPEGLPDRFHTAVKKKLERPRWIVNYDGQPYTIQEEIVDPLNPPLPDPNKKDYTRLSDAMQILSEQIGVPIDEVKEKVAKKESTFEYKPYRLPIEEAVSFNAESKPPTPVAQELTEDYREMYRDFIEKHVPILAEKIGANWNPGDVSTGTGLGAGGAGEGPFGGGGFQQPRAGGGAVAGQTDEPEEPYVVIWNRNNQTAILRKLAVFENAQDNVPTTLEMLYAQEDLWVLESIMEIIKKTNNDTNDPSELPHDLAPIKSIDNIEIGVEASHLGGIVGRLQSATPEGGVEGVGDPGLGGNEMLEGGVGEMQPGGLGVGPDGAPLAGVPDPGDGRYLDLQYKPLLAKDLRASYREKDPEKARLAVAKRMPVRLALTMDQRKLPDLIAACSNSRLPIEIRQVRVNRAPTVSGGDNTGQRSGIEGGPGLPARGQLPAGTDGTSGAGTTGKGMFDIPVEVFGVVYIYNPVAVETLQVKGNVDLGEEEPAEADAGDAAADAAP